MFRPVVICIEEFTIIILPDDWPVLMTDGLTNVKILNSGQDVIDKRHVHWVYVKLG